MIRQFAQKWRLSGRVKSAISGDSQIFTKLQELRSICDTTLTRLAELDEHASERHSRVSGGRLRLPLLDRELLVETVFGDYLVVPSFNIDIAIGLARDGFIEQSVTNLVTHIIREGDRCVNVGANFGYFSVLAAHLSGRQGKVTAIEANPYVFPYLLKSIYWSGFPDVIDAYCFAAYDQEDTLTMTFDPQFIGAGSVVNVTPSAVEDPADAFDDWSSNLWSGRNVMLMLDEKSKYVPTGLGVEVSTVARRLDSVLGDLRDTRLLLMDIEAAEPAALLGAATFLSSNPNVEIISEWSTYVMEGTREKTSRAAIDLLKRLGYQVYFVDPERCSSVGSEPILTKWNWDDLDQIGHGNVLFSKQLSFDAVVD